MVAMPASPLPPPAASAADAGSLFAGHSGILLAILVSHVADLASRRYVYARLGAGQVTTCEPAHSHRMAFTSDGFKSGAQFDCVARHHRPYTHGTPRDEIRRYLGRRSR